MREEGGGRTVCYQDISWCPHSLADTDYYAGLQISVGTHYSPRLSPTLPYTDCYGGILLYYCIITTCTEILKNIVEIIGGGWW